MSSKAAFPKSRDGWRESTKQFTDQDLKKGLHGLDWSSASKMTFPQFLLLRAYWQPNGADRFDLGSIVGAKTAQEARQLVESSTYAFFEAYLKVLRTRAGAPLRETTRCAPSSSGPFSLVLHQQDQVSDKEVPPGDGAAKVIISPRYKTRSTRSAAAAQKAAADISPTPIGGQDSTLADSFRKMTLKQQNTPPESTFVQASVTSTPEAQDDTWTGFETSPESTDSRISAFSQMSPEEVQAASDEQIVNAALVSFLQATIMYWCPNLEWTLHRNILKMGDLYEARTDGCLWMKGKEKTPLIILETKAYVRKANENRIMIQETAQMAAWIRQEKSGNLPAHTKQSPDVRRRLLISQDSREIYLTIGEYDSQYELYLEKTSAPSDDPYKISTHHFDHTEKGPMLKMTQYGPFDIQLANHMKLLATAIVAFTRTFQNA